MKHIHINHRALPCPVIMVRSGNRYNAIADDEHFEKDDTVTIDGEDEYKIIDCQSRPAVTARGGKYPGTEKPILNIFTVEATGIKLKYVEILRRVPKLLAYEIELQKRIIKNDKNPDNVNVATAKLAEYELLIQFKFF